MKRIKNIVLVFFICFCCVVLFILLNLNILHARKAYSNVGSQSIKPIEISSYSPPPTYSSPIADLNEYCKYINVPKTSFIPNLIFELTGRRLSEHEGYLYYPVKLTIKMNDSKIQEIDFYEEDFAPCRDEYFGFEYGDYKFDGYGGFQILSTSMGQNPSRYFWIWDVDKKRFVKYPDLELVGYMTFDYNNKLINVTNKGGASYHEFATYKYINDKLTLIKKVIDADGDGYRKIYELLNGEMKLIKTTKSQLK